MKAVVTGMDPLSRRIINDLKRGMRVKEVPELYPVTLDQAKKLSSYRNMLEQASFQLSEEAARRIELLGLKALLLGPFFRRNDWEGLSEIAAAITEETQRDELKLLIAGLKEKRERIRVFKEDRFDEISTLERKEKELLHEKQNLRYLQEAAVRQLSLFNQYPAGVRSFLRSVLGIQDNCLVLVRRLDDKLEGLMLKNNSIEYDINRSCYFVKDLEGLVSTVFARYTTGFVYKGENSTLSDTNALGLPEIIKIAEKEMKRIEDESVQLKAQLQSLRKGQAQAYIKMADTVENLSTEELKKHKELQKMALKWLFKGGFVAVEAFTMPNGKKADVVAFDDSRIVIVDVKASQNDLLMDRGWEELLPYCNDFYFLVPGELQGAVMEKSSGDKAGIMIVKKDGLFISQQDERPLFEVNGADLIRFDVARELAKRNIS